MKRWMKKIPNIWRKFLKKKTGTKWRKNKRLGGRFKKKRNGGNFVNYWSQIQITLKNYKVKREKLKTFYKEHSNIFNFPQWGSLEFKLANNNWIKYIFTGDSTNQVHMEGYQVSEQCMSLVRDSCLIPTKDAPELGYVPESTFKKYVPDVFYKVRFFLLFSTSKKTPQQKKGTKFNPNVIQYKKLLLEWITLKTKSRNSDTKAE